MNPSSDSNCSRWLEPGPGHNRCSRDRSGAGRRAGQPALAAQLAQRGRIDRRCVLAPGFTRLNVAYAVIAPEVPPARKLAVTLPVSQRGIRLGVEFLIRNEREPENDRYCRRREQAGAAWRWGSFFISTLPGLLT